MKPLLSAISASQLAWGTLAQTDAQFGEAQGLGCTAVRVCSCCTGRGHFVGLA